MKIYQVKHEFKENDYKQESTIDWDIEVIKRLSDLGVYSLWYWYGEASYEGSGYALLKRYDWKDKEVIGIVSLSHCSCYGPFDEDHNPIKWVKNIDDIEMSEGYRDEVKDLIEAYKKYEKEHE